MDDGAHDSQLLKGALTMVLLHLIEERESYGYDLVERVHVLGLTGVPDGSVYPALNRLEREGHVDSRLERSSAGPARKYYRLSDSGRQLLAERKRAWTALAEVIAPLLGDELSEWKRKAS